MADFDLGGEMGQMPVIHDSNDWRQINAKVDALSVGQATMQEKIEALERQQNMQHRENKEEIASMKTILLGDGDTPGLKTLMYAINSNLNLLKWLIGILIGALTIYYASREVRGKVAYVQGGALQMQDSAIPKVR